MGIFSLLADALDCVLAPAGALDTHSSAYCESVTTTTTTVETGTSPDWHNHWGTAADYQVPAESANAFSSHDWGSGCGSSSFGNDW